MKFWQNDNVLLGKNKMIIFSLFTEFLVCLLNCSQNKLLITLISWKATSKNQLAESFFAKSSDKFGQEESCNT